MAKLLETQLHVPVAAWLEADGWRVDAEVKDCDICATRGDEILIVELKTSLNFTLLVQAVERQRITDQVWVAVPATALGRLGRKRTNAIRVLRRLELGILAVAFPRNDTSVPPVATVVCHPGPFDRGRSEARARGRKAGILKEISGRRSNRNVAGQTGRPIHTAYREEALHIASLLAETGVPARARDLVLKGSSRDKTWSILYQNHYGWFTRCGDGTYFLSESGRSALEPSAPVHPEAPKGYDARE